MFAGTCEEPPPALGLGMRSISLRAWHACGYPCIAALLTDIRPRLVCSNFGRCGGSIGSSEGCEAPPAGKMRAVKQEAESIPHETCRPVCWQLCNLDIPCTSQGYTVSCPVRTKFQTNSNRERAAGTAADAALECRLSYSHSHRHEVRNQRDSRETIVCKLPIFCSRQKSLLLHGAGKLMPDFPDFTMHAESLGQHAWRVAESAGNWQNSGTGGSVALSCSLLRMRQF